MNSPYRTNGVWFKPRSKKELIDCIIKTGRWNGTKTALREKEAKQLRGIYNSLMQQITIDIMRKPSHLDNGTAQDGENPLTNIQQTHTQTNEVQHE